MNGFAIELQNHPGEMARVTEALAARGINILVYGLGTADHGAIGFVADDDEATRTALHEAGIRYREVPVLTVKMADKPGQAARVSRQLADAGVNIELWLPVITGTEPFTVAIGVDDLTTAQRILGDQVTTWIYQ